MDIRDSEDTIDTIASAAAEWKRYAKSSGVPDSTTERIDRVLLKYL